MIQLDFILILISDKISKPDLQIIPPPPKLSFPSFLNRAFINIDDFSSVVQGFLSWKPDFQVGKYKF